MDESDELALRDKAGNLRALVWINEADASLSLTLLDRAGIQRLTLSIDDTCTLLALADAMGKTRLSFMAGAEAPQEDGTLFTLYGRQPETACELGVLNDFASVELKSPSESSKLTTVEGTPASKEDFDAGRIALSRLLLRYYRSSQEAQSGDRR